MSKLVGYLLALTGKCLHLKAISYYEARVGWEETGIPREIPQRIGVTYYY